MAEPLTIWKIGTKEERRRDGQRHARPGRHRPLPQRRPAAARVLRRPVPAHQHRPGPGAPAEAAGLRRDRLGPRRVGAGADPQPARGPQAGVRPDHPLHRARPGRGEERERPGGRHVPRAALRDRAVRPPLRGPGPPLHGGPAGLRRRARPRGRPDVGPRSRASRRARSTRRRAAASAPAARGPRPAAPRRSPRCARSRPGHQVACHFPIGT